MNGNNRILYRLIDSVFRSGRLIIVSSLAVALGAAVAMRLVPDKYTASAAVRVLSDETATTVGVTSFASSGGKEWVSPAQQNANRFEDLLNDNQPGGFLDSALYDSQLIRPINVDPKAKDPRCQALLKALSAKADSDTMFSINLTWDNAGECQRIVKALEEQYIEQVADGQQAQARATERFLDGQLGQYERRMLTAEEALTRYKQQNSGQLPEAQTSLNDQLSKLKSQMDALRVSAQDNALKRQALLQRIAVVHPTTREETTEAATGGVGEDTSSEDDADLQMTALEKQRQHLLTMYQEASPVVREIEDQISALKARAASPKPPRAAPSHAGRLRLTKVKENPEYQQLMQRLTDANIADTTQKAQMALLQQQITEYEGRLRTMPVAQRELAEKTRDYNILKAEYDKLAERREQAKIKSSLDKVTARSMFSPIGRIAAQPSMGGKKLLLILGGGLALSLMLSAVIVFVREWTDPTLRYEEDVQKALAVPFMVSLPEATEAQPPRSQRGGAARARPRATTTSALPRWAPDLSMRMSETEL